MFDKPLGPFPTPASYQPIVERLRYMIERNNWKDKFEKAVTDAHNTGVEDMVHIKTLTDFYNFLNYLLLWVPIEDETGTFVYNMQAALYFVLDQEPVKKLQSPIAPTSYPPPQLTGLSQWIVDYCRATGDFLSTPQSLTKESLETFYKAKNYNLDSYETPEGGWLGHSFNEFFARRLLPGTRPIDGPDNPAVIVSPADSSFDGSWDISPNSTVAFSIKGLTWGIDELLANSQYANEFAGGKFMHSYLSPSDYHRFHAPVSGKVLEATVISGQAFYQVIVHTRSDGKQRLGPVRQIELEGLDDPGYQFCQTRGLFVIDSPNVGKVAFLPVGMCQVSSVQITACKGSEVKKGDEVGHFQFGGSDVVLVFQAHSRVEITAKTGKHYNMGQQIAIAHAAES